MARPLRVKYPGAVYHVTSRGNARNKIFRGKKAKAQRDISINAAHMSHGHTLEEIADSLGIHYTTGSKVIAKKAVSKK
jgi:REP element-mobilizing transposase RayT